MKSKDRFTNLIFVGSALALALFSFLSYERIHRQVEASDSVSGTQLLKFKLNDAFSHLIKTETAQRGFLLTGNHSFLLDYSLAKQPLPQLLSEIKSLISQNPQQQENFKVAVNLFNTRLGYIQHTLEISKGITKHQMDSVLAEGKNITDSLSRQINQMIITEDHLLAGRMAKKQMEENRTSFWILLFSAASVAILIYSFFRIKKETTNNAILEQMVVERTKDIKEANETLNQQYAELKKRTEELSSFTFIANHDLKEPLRKIEFFFSQIKNSGNALSLGNQALMVKINECIVRMKDLLDDIFIYTLTEKTSQLEDTDLNGIAAKSIKSLHEAILEKQAIVECGHLPTIKAVPGQIERLFTNLLSNSLKYSRKDVCAHIKIEAQKQNGIDGITQWQISIADNGIGFDEIYKEKIFGMFKRLHLKNEYPGTGMGLAICKKIAENHNATITASARKGEGAVFTLIFPES